MLKDVFRNKVVERIEGMDVFEELFVPVYYSLLVMKENNNTVHCLNLLMILNLLSSWL